MLFQTVVNCDDSVDTTVFLVVLSIGAAIGVTYLIIGAFINRIGKKTILIGSSHFQKYPNKKKGIIFFKVVRQLQGFVV